MSDDKIRIKVDIKPPKENPTYAVREGWILVQSFESLVDLQSKQSINLYVEGREGTSDVTFHVTFVKDDNDQVINCYGNLMLSSRDGDTELLYKELDLDPAKMFHECFEEVNNV